ncbi:hypothetical protein V8G54_019112 [Vigna mungo]|uniref:Transmembrane protein n=1 Tax=Vigna mungo TaxID=3915 RepID=A0AAQ3NBE3_VIGMU
MVHYHRSHQPRKPNADSTRDEDSHTIITLDCSTSSYYIKRTRPKLLSFLLLITFLSCCYVFAPLFLPTSFSFSHLCKQPPSLISQGFRFFFFGSVVGFSLC